MPKFNMRFVTVNARQYLRVEDVARFLRDVGATEETDVRRRLDQAALSLEKSSQEFAKP